MKRFFIVVGLILLTLRVAAQGTIVDARTHEALPGVSISLEDTLHQVKGLGATDAKGKFTLPKLPNTGWLKFSMTGYTTQTIQLTTSAPRLDVAMEPLPVDLQPVIVSASREQQSRRDAPIAISKISSTQIQDTKATALYQLLNKVSGVYMVNLGNEQHTMAIRQPITYNALYLYMEDGLPIRPTGIFNHNALYEINMSGVRDIEVIKGPASSLYGSNAIGGAINFISQGPAAGYAGNVFLQGDGYHYRRVDLSQGFSNGKAGFYVGGYAARQNNSWQDYSDFDKYSLNFKNTYHFTANTRLTTSATYNYLNTQTPGALDSTKFYSRSYGANQRFTYRKVNAFRASTRLEHSWSERSNTSVTLFYRNNSTAQLPSYYIADVRNSAGQYVSSNGQVNDQSFHSFGVLAQHRSDFDFLHSRLIAGVYVDDSPSTFYAQQLNIQKDAGANFYTGFTNTGTYIDDYRIGLFNYAAYTQYELRPLEALRIVAGLRYDHVHYNFTNKLTSTTRYKSQETNNYNVLAPKLGFTYDLGDNKGLYANYSLGFQPPETSSLYSSRQLSALKQANFSNCELGGWISTANKKLYAEVSLYDMEGRNEIISQLLPDNTTQNLNAGATRHLGVEYTVIYAPLQSIGLRFSGTNARHTFVDYSEVRTANGKSYSFSFNGNRMNNAPSWIANTELSLRPSFTPGFLISGEWQHLGSYFTDPANTKAYSGYNIYNLRLNYQCKTSALKGAGIWLNVLNLTDKLYATTVISNQYGDTYTAAPPRTVTLGISYALSKY